MGNMIKKSQSGFTMIELIISIFIIMMISGLVMANYRAGQRSYELKNSALQLANTARTAENYALGLKKNEKTTSFPRQGWGIYIDKTKTEYVLFGDDDIAASPPRLYEAGEKYLASELLNGVAVDKIELSSSTPLWTGEIMSLSNLSIVFAPPDPSVYVNNSSSTTARITLKHNVSNATSAIEINPLGMINIR